MSVTINHETNDISATSGSLTIDGGSTIPTGVIVMWSGTNADIPSGWALCDGTNGTPNLVDRFILARSAASNTNTTGGSNTVTLAETNLPSHSHAMSSVTTGAGGDHTHGGTGANHSHSYIKAGRYTYQGASFAWSGYFNNIGTNQRFSGDVMIQSTNTGSGGGSSFNTNSSGNHTHSISGNTDASGSGTSVTITPTYFTLAFIMKT